MFRDAAGRLGTYSSCIDAADNTAVPAGIEIDLDANPRFGDSVVIGDTGNGTPPIVDMGAYEFYQYVLYVDADATGRSNAGLHDTRAPERGAAAHGEAFRQPPARASVSSLRAEKSCR